MPDFGRWTSNGGDPSLNEINRTDRFLDALASQQPVYSTDPGEAELANLLAGWRDEVREAPLTAPVTPRDATVALRRAVESRQRTRMSMAVVGSAAAALLCLGGFGAVVAGAGPGDALYGLRTMLFGEQQATRDDQVVLAAQTQLAEVQQLIDQGQWEAAQDKLQAVTTTVATVDDVGRQQELVNQLQELSVKVETKDANATVPPNAPPVTLPVIVDPGTTTSSETTTTSSETTTTSSETTTSSSETTTSSSETTTSSSETTTSSSETTTSTTTSPPVQQPPVTTTSPPTTTTSPPTTTTTTTTSATTTTTTTTTSAPGVPAAGAGGAEVVAPPTSSAEGPRLRGPESPVTEAQETVTVPVTTTTPVIESGEDGQ